MAHVARSHKARRRKFKAEQQQHWRINVFGRVSDRLWAVFVKYLPPEPPSRRRGRPVVPYRRVLEGIIFHLRTGCQWKAIPAEFGSGSTCHRRFQEWRALGIFAQVWADRVHAYDQTRGIAWNWQILDSAIIPAPLGGAKTGKKPDGSGQVR